MALFTGSGVAIVTPFDQQGEVDYRKLEELVQYQIVHKTDAIIICGTTGETPTLSEEEHLECIRTAVHAAKGKVPVIAGAGSNNTRHAIGISKGAEKYGADGLLIVTPYYNKTTQKGLVAYFNEIAGATGLPIIAYNVPARTGLNMLPVTVAEINRIPNVVGIKEASGNIAQVGEVMQRCQGEIDLYAGNDSEIVPILSLGGSGVISVIANILPEETHDVVQRFMEGDWQGSLALQMKLFPVVSALFSEVSPGPVKHAMNLMGLGAGPVRSPLTAMEPANEALLIKALQDYGIQL